MADRKKDVKKLVEEARRRGWQVAITGGTHWRFASPDKKVAVQFVSFTPSDYRALANIKSQLRKAGLQI